MFKLNYDFIVPYFIDLHVQCIIIKVVPFLHWSGKQDCDWIGYTVEINVIVINEIHVIFIANLSEVLHMYLYILYTLLTEYFNLCNKLLVCIFPQVSSIIFW